MDIKLVKPKRIANLPVSKLRPAYHQIADQIRELIMRGGILPGEQLPSEAQLSANFGVSRNTTREALRMLSSQGLVQTSRGVSGGTFIAIPDPIFVQNNIENGLGLMSGGNQLTPQELFETRLVLEIPAARWAAERHTEDDLVRMRIAAASVERSQVVSLREREFITAVTTAGGSGWWIMRKHLLPNVLPAVLVLAAFDVGVIITVESSLSFIGLGIQPPTPSLGLMIAEGQRYLQTNFGLTLLPALVIFCLIGGIQFASQSLSRPPRRG